MRHSTAIIDRKRREIDDAGYALWGYGGNTCHPLTMVQPFARDFVQRDGIPSTSCMQPMASKHFASSRGPESSADGIDWDVIPPAINVLGSRYALAIGDLEQTEFDAPARADPSRSAPSVGRRGDQLHPGRVDKACLEVLDEPGEPAADAVAARDRPCGTAGQPYAVLRTQLAAA